MKQNAQTSNKAPILLQPDNHNKKYEALFLEIDSGQLKLPLFQREFVWDKEQSAKLVDSILRGYPVGTFIFWKTREELRSYKDIGNHQLPETPRGDYVQYILDGQQRVTSLYAIRKGIRITKDGREIDYKDIFINLDIDITADEQITSTEQVDGQDYISVHDVLTRKMGDLFKNRNAEKRDKIEEYKSRLTGYDFSSITIKDYPIEVACEVFSRINTGGRVLTVFEIMVAKTYDEALGFDLAERFEILRDGSDDDQASLAAAKFDTISAATVLQSVAAIAVRTVRSRDILKIPRKDFIASWEPMKDSLFSAIDFLRGHIGVPISQLLPYPALLVPLTYFFHTIKNKKPTHEQSVLLEQFFYWAGLNSRYSSSTESKIEEDLKKMDLVREGRVPQYLAVELEEIPENIAGTAFSAGNAYCKTILCLLASQRPRSLDTNSEVILDNSHLKISSSRNYHHFFPQQFLAENDPEKSPNLIANITLMDGYSNKHRIGKKAPSDYVTKFGAKNKEIGKSLKSHLIGDIKAFGIVDDDYDKFIARRSKAIVSALAKKMQPEL